MGERYGYSSSVNLSFPVVIMNRGRTLDAGGRGGIRVCRTTPPQLSQKGYYRSTREDRVWGSFEIPHKIPGGSFNRGPSLKYLSSFPFVKLVQIKRGEGRGPTTNSTTVGNNMIKETLKTDDGNGRWLTGSEDGYRTLASGKKEGRTPW